MGGDSGSQIQEVLLDWKQFEIWRHFNWDTVHFFKLCGTVLLMLQQCGWWKYEYKPHNTVCQLLLQCLYCGMCLPRRRQWLTWPRYCYQFGLSLHYVHGPMLYQSCSVKPTNRCPAENSSSIILYFPTYLLQFCRFTRFSGGTTVPIQLQQRSNSQ